MKLLTRLAMFLSFFVMVQYANAASNIVIVDQIGSSSTINLTQTGQGNSIGDSTNHAVLNGNSNVITIDQIGNNNTAAVSVDGDNNTLSHSFTGNYNDLSLLCVTCSSITMTDTIYGTSNIISRNFDTSASTSTINIQSDNNSVTINNDTTAIAGAQSTVDISGGNGNTVQIRQTGAAGTNGHDANLTIVGATNTVNIDQGGNVDSSVTATITGSGNTMHINSNY
jgi:Curlin associated repeat